MSNEIKNKGVLRTYNDVQEWISENLEANQIPKSQNSVKVSIDYLNSSDIDLSPREYQREKVASYQWKVDLIKREVEKNTFPYAVLMENCGSDFNLSTLVRNANAFGAKEVFYLKDKKRWDKRGAVGTYHYTNVQHLSSYDQIEELKNVIVKLSNGKTIPAKMGKVKLP